MFESAPELIEFGLQLFGAAAGAGIAAWKTITKVVNSKIDRLAAEAQQNHMEAMKERKELKISLADMRERLRATSERVAVLWHMQDDTPTPR